MATAPLWVAVLHITPRVAEKIRAKHDLEPEDIRAAVVCRAGLVYTWDEHPEYGWRAIVETTIGERSVRVVLFPDDHPAVEDEYQLGTAHPNHR